MGEEILMSVKGLTGETFENVSFDLHRGEVIAITGLQGAGSGELATALFGGHAFKKRYGRDKGRQAEYEEYPQCNAPPRRDDSLQQEGERHSPGPEYQG